MLILVTVFYTRNQKSIDAMSTLISKKKKKFLLENYYTFLLLDDIYIDFLTEQSGHLLTLKLGSDGAETSVFVNNRPRPNNPVV